MASATVARAVAIAVLSKIDQSQPSSRRRYFGLSEDTWACPAGGLVGGG